MEAVRTNIIGTDNVITAAVENEIKRVVFLSTDKAAYPINTMGMTKAVGEKVVQARAQKAFERILEIDKNLNHDDKNKTKK